MYDVYVDGKNFGKNGSAYSIILSGPSLDGKQQRTWERSFNAAEVTSTQAVLYGVLFGLKSIKKELRGDKKVVVHLSNKAAFKYMALKSDTEWKNSLTPTNRDLVVGVRNVASEFFPNISFELTSDDMMVRASKLTERAVKEGKYIDYRG